MAVTAHDVEYIGQLSFAKRLSKATQIAIVTSRPAEN